MIIVLADDLSGATELAGVAWARGLSAEVQTEFDPHSPATLIAIDTDTRCASAGEAARVVGETALLVLAAKPSWIYKKTDSVLRGHIRGELTALLAALSQARALFISANPTRRRLIQDGRYYINGTPLDHTIFATDPEHPARSSDVRELLSREPGAPVHLLGSSQALPEAGIAIPDAVSSADLARYAELLDDATLPAGAAEFFDAVLAHRYGATARVPAAKDPSTRPPMTLLVCGSAAAWPVSRRRCEQRGIPVFEVPAPIIRQSQQAAQAISGLSDWAAEVSRKLMAVTKSLVSIGGLQVPPGCPPSHLLKALAQSVAGILSVAPVDRVLLEGGATAAAVLRQMNWKRLTVEENLGTGLPLLRVTGRGSLLLVIKPGSYEWPESVWD